jgi:HemK-related putative methylase
MKHSINSKTIYEPQEDSHLMVECVKKYAKGSVLDMGTGSGIQGITALNVKSVKSVMFSDINPAALNYVKENSGLEISKTGKPVLYRHSDLYAKIPEKFDTIIFNPPYLPDDEFDNEKLITTGGKHGHEIFERFLTDSKSHLNIDGTILLLLSSLSGKGEIDAKIRELGYTKNQIAKLGLFMEQLYVYSLKITDSSIIKGHRGIVEICTKTIKGEDKLVAIKRSLTEHYDASNEARFLKMLNKSGIGPKLIKVDKKNNALVMEYIQGERILDYFADKYVKKKQIKQIFEDVLMQLYSMDISRINKLEMTNPYKHIIIRDEKPVMIDFERCIYTEKPKNITQFIQFLCSGKLQHILKEKNIQINSSKLMTIAREYKDSYDEKYLSQIMDCIV